MDDFPDPGSPVDAYEDLPSESAGTSSQGDSDFEVNPRDDWDEDEEDDTDDAEQEWKESLQQLELLLSMVIVPYVGKYFGRKCAYWGWGKFMEWKYPVEIVVTSPKTFKGVGAVEAAL